MSKLNTGFFYPRLSVKIQQLLAAHSSFKKSSVNDQMKQGPDP